MRFSIAVAAIFGAVSASAVLLPRQFPDCATACMANADPGSCQVTDNHCLCEDAAFVNSVTSCITSSCTGADLQTSLDGAQQLCAAVGVTLTSTPAASATPSGAASSGSAASPSASPNAGMSNTVNTVAGIVALGAAVLAL
ncbi:hypothetical protein BDN72DRAFT_769779 [Pluteus cervinus]|uniref:Uncharacterized protein n=1 Tax=Pluteus cervinus TaxID=181527 RepID=A0ACD3AR44_9AGAR|nr:hypothetical protein BDN72DRAFT_769779 [Pluteus cervinus]